VVWELCLLIEMLGMPVLGIKFVNIQGVAEITPTFQRGITNKWYEVSPKTFYVPNVDIKKFFYFRF
jgi:hypothetical protein